jgi:hypothetical protein
MTLPSRLALALAGLVPLLTAGCQDPLNRGGAVRGQVRIDGEPVTAGNVLFVSEDGKWTGIGPINGKGEYVVKEPPLGKVQIAVQTEMYRNFAPPARGAPAHDGGGGPPGSKGMVLPDPAVRGLVYKPIPAKFESVDTSDLSYVVVRGDQTHDLELSSK